MTSKYHGVHVVTTTRRYKGKTYHSHLLRRSYREGDKVKKETVANLTKLGTKSSKSFGRPSRAKSWFAPTSSSKSCPPSTTATSRPC